MLFADDLLPGVGGEPMTLSKGLRRRALHVRHPAAAEQSLDELEGAALSVLAPDIRDVRHQRRRRSCSSRAASAAFFVLGAVPMGWLADRFRRGPMIGWASALLRGHGVLLRPRGQRVHAVLARFGVGIAKSNTIPVHGSLIADNYPIGIRGRMSARRSMVGRRRARRAEPGARRRHRRARRRRRGLALGVLPARHPRRRSSPSFAFRIPEPPRGQYEKSDVLGEVIEDAEPAPISMEAAFARLKQIRTIRTAMLAFAALGFGLFTGAGAQNLYLDDQLRPRRLRPGRRSAPSAGSPCCRPPVRRPRTSTAATARTRPRRCGCVGLLILPVGALHADPVLDAQRGARSPILGIPQAVLLITAFTMVGPVLQAVVPVPPARHGHRAGAMYIFFIGAIGGALLAGFFTNASARAAAVLAARRPVDAHRRAAS